MVAVSAIPGSGGTGPRLEYFGNSREDLCALIPETARSVLEVGCGAGGTGRVLRRQGRGPIIGVEIHPDAAAAARNVFDRVIVGDVEALDLTEYRGFFDCILYGDVLEHLRDPWQVLSDARDLLKPGGVVIASIPNVRHYTVWVDLVARGRWEYQDSGLLDRTHLRFFTRASILDLFARAGLADVAIRERFVAPAHLRWLRFLPGPFRDYLCFQYIVTARKGADATP